MFAELNKYDATTHFVGQSTIFTLTPDRATGEAYCLAHHVTVDGGKRRLMVASVRVPSVPSPKSLEFRRRSVGCFSRRERSAHI